MSADMPAQSPWMGLPAAAAYLGPNRSTRFVAREMRAGRIRAARIGGKGEWITRAEWLDEYILNQAAPIAVAVRRRA